MFCFPVLREECILAGLGYGKIQTAVVTDNTIYVSTSSGATWSQEDSIRYWKAVAMSSDGKIQTAVDAGAGGNIYVSTDYGDNWSEKDSDRIWSAVAVSSDGKIQTAVANPGQIYVSTNYGATWTAKDSSRAWRSAAMSSDGKIQTAVVFGGDIYVSHADSFIPDGNTGIGITTPTSKLTVAGSIDISDSSSAL